MNNSGNATFAGDVTIDEKIVALGGLAAFGSGDATINVFSREASSNLFSALRIISQPAASNYWDIGATGGASTILNFYHNGTTTPKMTLNNSGDATFAGEVTLNSKLIFDSGYRSLHLQSGTTQFSCILPLGELIQCLWMLGLMHASFAGPVHFCLMAACKYSINS